MLGIEKVTTTSFFFALVFQTRIRILTGKISCYLLHQLAKFFHTINDSILLIKSYIPKTCRSLTYPALLTGIFAPDLSVAKCASFSYGSIRVICAILTI